MEYLFLIPISQQYLESLAIKLKSVVRDEGMGYPKLGDNVLPHEPFGIHILDVY